MKKKGIMLAVIAAVMVCLVLTGPAFSAQKAKLRILFTDVHTPLLKRMEVLIDEYTQANPNIEIVMDSVAWGASLAKVAAMKAAGNPPDLIYAIPSQIWMLQQEEWLIPVDDIIHKLGGDQYFQATPLYVKVNDHIGLYPREP